MQSQRGYSTMIQDYTSSGSAGVTSGDRIRIVSTLAVRNDLDFRSRYNQGRSKFVKIAKQEDGIRKSSSFMSFVIDVKGALGKGKDTRQSRKGISELLSHLSRNGRPRWSFIQAYLPYFSLFHGIYMLLRSHFRRAIFAFAIRCARFSSYVKLKFLQCEYKRRSYWHSICIHLLHKEFDINKRKDLCFNLSRF